MSLSAEAKLRAIAENERKLASPIGLPVAAVKAIETAANVCEKAEALLEDIRRRHPGEDFTCPFIAALDEALAAV